MPRLNRMTEAELDLRAFFNPETSAASPMTPQESEDSFIFVLPLNARSSLRRTQTESVTGAAGVQSVQGSVVPADRYRYFASIDVSHNDVPAHTLLIAVLDPGAALPPGDGAGITTATQPTNVRLISPRSILLPTGWAIKARSLDALGVAAQLVLRMVFIEYSFAEIAPDL